MKKSEWLDCQRNEFFPKQKGIPSLVKIEHKNTATLDSARSKKKSKVAVLQLSVNAKLFINLFGAKSILYVYCQYNYIVLNIPPSLPILFIQRNDKLD